MRNIIDRLSTDQEVVGLIPTAGQTTRTAEPDVVAFQVIVNLDCDSGRDDRTRRLEGELDCF